MSDASTGAPSSADSADIVIVGGGVAGLVAARRVAASGRSVIVLEADARPGGQIRRHRLAGVDLDAAADSFATRDGTVAALLTEIGLGDDIVVPPARAAWVYRADGTAAALPATGVLGIPADPLAPDVVAAIGRPAALRARWDAVLPGRVGADAATLGELVRRRMGDGVLAGLVAPVVRGVHSREPDELAVDAASPHLRALLRQRGSLAAAVRAIRAAAPAGSQVAGIRGGMFRMVDTLVADCERLGVRWVGGIRVDAVSPSTATAGARTFSGLVVLAGADPAGAPPPRRRLTLVTIVADAPGWNAAPRGTGVLVAADAPDVAARALTHLTAKWQWIADALPGRHVVRLSYDGDQPDAVATALSDAQTLLGSAPARVIDADVLAVDRPVPSPPVARSDGIPAVGEAASGTGLAAVVGQADRVASGLLERFGAGAAASRDDWRTRVTPDRMEQ